MLKFDSNETENDCGEIAFIDSIIFYSYLCYFIIRTNSIKLNVKYCSNQSSQFVKESESQAFSFMDFTEIL